ncbi:MAG TPA: transketolase C-terminal domain-containing protein [Candidatus Eisenbacteria bacterium]|nr:transketolase C-terminal domain-containing protein [Candidatus Eisenbacteria bacterium]
MSSPAPAIPTAAAPTVSLAKPEMKRTREGFGHGLVDLGEKRPEVFVLVGDLSGSTNVSFFAQKFPDRFLQVGVAEQNMMCVAAGLAAVGKIPYLATYGAFASCRSADQMRVTVAYTDLPVKIGGAHGGISVGPDGATHQAMEEIAIVRSIPNMKMIVPCDYWETRKATVSMADDPHPNYIRFGREPVPVVTGPETPFTIGKANVMREGKDIALIACGVMVYEALVAAEELSKRGIGARVVNMHTIKPLDMDAIERAARECGAIVTAEEHQIHGGLGGAVAEAVVRLHPVPMELVAVHDRFGRSGKQDELMAAFGIKAPDIVRAADRALSRKRTSK